MKNEYADTESQRGFPEKRSHIAPRIQKRGNKALRLQAAFKFRCVSGIKRPELFSHGEGGARHGCLAARAGYLPRHLVFGRQRTTKELEDLLNQLRKHIQADAMLSAGDKQDLLEQTDALEKAKQLSDIAKKTSVARQARKIFDATLKALPVTAVLVESCDKILPVVLKLLGVQLP